MGWICDDWFNPLDLGSPSPSPITRPPPGAHRIGELRSGSCKTRESQIRGLKAVVDSCQVKALKLQSQASFTSLAVDNSSKPLPPPSSRRQRIRLPPASAQT